MPLTVTRERWRSKTALALLLALAGPGSAAVPDIATVTLLPDSEARWVPYTPTASNQLRFVARVDGAAVSAILDTGASVSMLSRDYARHAGLRVVASGRATAIGGPVPLGWAATGTLAFGGLSRSGGGLNVVALGPDVTGELAAVDLLVGRDLTDRFALEIDPSAHRFRLLPSGRLPFVGTRAPLTIGTVPQAYVTELRIAGRRVRPVIVDTGDGGALTLAREVWRTLPLDPYPATTTQLTYGAGGAVQAAAASIAGVTVGQRVVRDVTVAIEPSGGFSDAARAAGRIGMGLLGRYRILLDPGAGHMVLADAPAATVPPRSTSGLQAVAMADRLRVVHVMRASPAASAGWRAGDSICAVDGIAVDRMGPAQRTRLGYGVAGSTLTLTDCDGRVRTMTLRAFY